MHRDTKETRQVMHESRRHHARDQMRLSINDSMTLNIYFSNWFDQTSASS